MCGACWLQSGYVVLKEAQIEEEMNHAISEVASVLSTPNDEAAAVLRLCKWWVPPLPLSAFPAL